jgi:hypothetical protein
MGSSRFHPVYVVNNFNHSYGGLSGIFPTWINFIYFFFKDKFLDPKGSGHGRTSVKCMERGLWAKFGSYDNGLHRIQYSRAQ